jgi:hypothetical protein
MSGGGYYADTKITDRDGDYLAINTDGSINVVGGGSSTTKITDGTDTLLVNADGSLQVGLNAGQTIKINDGTDTLLVNTNGTLPVERLPKYLGITSASSARTTSGTTGNIALTGTPTMVEVTINITAVAGTTPTIIWFVQASDANGIMMDCFPRIAAAAPIAGTQLRICLGPTAGSNVIGTPTAASVMEVGCTSMIFPPTGNILLGWTIAGTTPSVTFQYGINQWY